MRTGAGQFITGGGISPAGGNASVSVLSTSINGYCSARAVLRAGDSNPTSVSHAPASTVYDTSHYTSPYRTTVPTS